MWTQIHRHSREGGRIRIIIIPTNERGLLSLIGEDRRLGVRVQHKLLFFLGGPQVDYPARISESDGGRRPNVDGASHGTFVADAKLVDDHVGGSDQTADVQELELPHLG